MENFYTRLMRPDINHFREWLSRKDRTDNDDQRVVFNTKLFIEYLDMLPNRSPLYIDMFEMCEDWLESSDRSIKRNGKYILMIRQEYKVGLVPLYGYYENGMFMGTNSIMID